MGGRMPGRSVQGGRVRLLDTSRERLAGALLGTAVVTVVEAAAVAAKAVGAQRALAARRVGRAAAKVMAAAAVAVAGVAAVAVAVEVAGRSEGRYLLWLLTGQARPWSWCPGR